MDSYSEEYITELLKMTNINQSDLPEEIVRILYYNGLNTLYDLCKISCYELRYRIKGIGMARERKIKEFMRRYGLGFMEKGYGPYTDSLLFLNSRDTGESFDYSKVKVDTIIEDMLNK